MKTAAPRIPRSRAGVLRSSRRRSLLAAAVSFSAVFVVACGASIGSLYESEVRFEHCMALDERSEVKPTLRRTCWDEWLRFYTFGQNRDRIDWARSRVRQLGSVSDFAEQDWEQEASTPLLAVPDPTSIMAPPPMMLTPDKKQDGGVASASPPPAPGGLEPDAGAATNPCAEECDAALAYCQQECSSAGCSKSCDGKYRRCIRRCF